MDGIRAIFFDMGNTLLHFHQGKSDDEKDEKGLIYLTEYLNKFNSNITFAEVMKECFKKAGIYDLIDNFTFRNFMSIRNSRVCMDWLS